MRIYKILYADISLFSGTREGYIVAESMGSATRIIDEQMPKSTVIKIEQICKDGDVVIVEGVE